MINVCSTLPTVLNLDVQRIKWHLIALAARRSSVKVKKTFGFLAISLMFVVSPVQASVVYQYVGNNYTSILDNDPPVGTYTTSMNVSGHFTVPAPLDMATDGDISSAVTAYSFSDGRFTLTESNSSIFRFDVFVDADNDISTWNILVDTPGVPMEAIFSSLLLSDTLDSTFAGVCPVSICGRDDLGTLEVDVAWSDGGGNWSVAPVPIPAAFWLFASGLLGLITLVRRKKAA